MTEIQMQKKVQNDRLLRLYGTFVNRGLISVLKCAYGILFVKY